MYTFVKLVFFYNLQCCWFPEAVTLYSVQSFVHSTLQCNCILLPIRVFPFYMKTYVHQKTPKKYHGQDTSMHVNLRVCFMWMCFIHTHTYTHTYTHTPDEHPHTNKTCSQNSRRINTSLKIFFNGFNKMQTIRNWSTRQLTNNLSEMQKQMVSNPETLSMIRIWNCSAHGWCCLLNQSKANARCSCSEVAD